MQPAAQLSGDVRRGDLEPSLEALPGAAALLDLELRVVSANSRFLALSGASGEGLFDLLPPEAAAPSAPGEGEQVRYLARGVGGKAVEVSLSRRGEVIGALAQAVAADAGVTPLAAALQTVAEQSQILDALLTLSREVALAAAEDELIAAIARCVRQLFPGRFFCVRIVDPHTSALTSLYAEGRLLENTRERLAVRRASAEKAHLDLGALPEDRVVLTEEEPLVFAGSRGGFATPLVAAGKFFGVLNLEYAPGSPCDPLRDEKLLIQLANQAAIGVRNAKLIEELTFVRKFLEELIENANALILVVNRDREVMVFNKALVGLLGYEPLEVVGTDAALLVSEPLRAATREVIERSLLGEAVTCFETAFLKKAGGEVRSLLSTSAVRTPAGEVEGVIAIGQDLSVQRELERQVVQAEKLASLGQLAAGVVHEINNPLTTITLVTDALLQRARARPADPGEIEKLARIRESADRILTFARDLTSYARPAHERPEELDVPELIDQAARYCEYALKQSGAKLERTFSPELRRVRGVRMHLVQVFVNLIINASHALVRGEGRVSIAARLEREGVLIEVQDDGVGIEPEHLVHIFEPFFTTKVDGRGTGLGLTIVQGIVERHGGSVRVLSEPGEGTTFSVWLPTAAALEPLAWPLSRPAAFPPASPSPGNQGQEKRHA
jgi:two-component system NtrC family sensor kinase